MWTTRCLAIHPWFYVRRDVLVLPPSPLNTRPPSQYKHRTVHTTYQYFNSHHTHQHLWSGGPPVHERAECLVRRPNPCPTQGTTHPRAGGLVTFGRIEVYSQSSGAPQSGFHSLPKKMLSVFSQRQSKNVVHVHYRKNWQAVHGRNRAAHPWIQIKRAFGLLAYGKSQFHYQLFPCVTPGPRNFYPV